MVSLRKFSVAASTFNSRPRTAVCHGGRRASRTATSYPRNHTFRPRRIVRRRPVRPHVHVCRAHTELVELGLAADVSAGVNQPAHAGRIVWRDIACVSAVQEALQQDRGPRDSPSRMSEAAVVGAPE